MFFFNIFLLAFWERTGQLHSNIKKRQERQQEMREREMKQRSPVVNATEFIVEWNILLWKIWIYVVLIVSFQIQIDENILKRVELKRQMLQLDL